jgi:hypothetical protein
MNDPVIGGQPMPEPVPRMMGEPLGGWQAILPLGGFGAIGIWGDAAVGLPVLDGNGQRYRLEPQPNYAGSAHPDEFLMLRNLSGGASLGFAGSDPVDHLRFKLAS